MQKLFKMGRGGKIGGRLNKGEMRNVCNWQNCFTKKNIYSIKKYK